MSPVPPARSSSVRRGRGIERRHQHAASTRGACRATSGRSSGRSAARRCRTRRAPCRASPHAGRGGSRNRWSRSMRGCRSFAATYSVPRPHAGTPRGRDRDAWPPRAAGGPRHRARHRASARSALAAARGPAEPPDRRARHRLPPARQIHPDAPRRRRFRAAASRHVRPDGADARCGPTSRRRTSTWCWRPTMAGAWASSIRAASARSIWCRRRRRTPTGCWPDLGPEPLDAGLLAGLPVGAALAGKRTPIKAALLDQKVVAGLGNIYVCEALFRARLSPQRSAHTIPGTRAARLVPAIKDDAARGDRRRRFVAARLCPAGRRAGLLPARLEGLRPRGRGLRALPRPPRLPRHPPHHPVGAQHVLLPAYPAVGTSRPPPAGRAHDGRIPEHHRRDAWPGRADPAQPPDGAERAVRRVDGRARAPSCWRSTTIPRSAPSC